MEFMNVKQFSAESDICRDLTESVKKYAAETIKERKGVACFGEHTKAEMKELINKAFAECVAEKSGYALPKEGASKMEIQRYSENPLVKTFAEQTRNILIDAIIPDFIIESPLQYIADVQTADLGDTIKFDIHNNQLLTVSKAGNRQRNTNVQKTFDTDVTMSGENHEVTLQTNLYDILVGRTFIAEEIMKAALAIENDMLDSAYDAFLAAMDELDGTELVVANYTERALIHLCEVIGSYNNATPIIIGTPLALKGVLPDNTNYRYFLDSEYVKLGHVNTFNTYDVVPMAQKANPYSERKYALKFDDSKLFVVTPATDKIVKMGIFGGTMSRQNAPEESANLSVLHTIVTNYSVECITNSIAGMVKNIG